MHELVSPFVLAALLATLPGCFLFNPDTSPPAEVEHCNPSGIGDGAKGTRNVSLGDGQGAAFVPYRDSGQAKTVTGGQGLTMVTPVVRVAAASADPAEMCLMVRILSEYGAGGAGGGNGAGGSGGGSYDPQYESSTVLLGAKFARNGDYLFTSGPIYNPVDNFPVTLTATVTGTDFEATETVTVK
jgi:hypothetical protein